MTLSEFLTDRKTGRIKRGALSRAAEYLSVNPSSVLRWVRGEWIPSTEMNGKIQDMIHARIDLSPHPKISRRFTGATTKNTPTNKPNGNKEN